MTSKASGFVRYLTQDQASSLCSELSRIGNPPTPNSVSWVAFPGQCWTSKSVNPAFVRVNVGQRPPPHIAKLPVEARLRISLWSAGADGATSCSQIRLRMKSTAWTTSGELTCEVVQSSLSRLPPALKIQGITPAKYWTAVPKP